MAPLPTLPNEPFISHSGCQRCAMPANKGELLQALKDTGNALLKAGRRAAAAAAYTEALLIAGAAAADSALQALLLSNRSHAHWCCNAFAQVTAYTDASATPCLTPLQADRAPCICNTGFKRMPLHRQPRMQSRQLRLRPPGPSHSIGWHRRALQAQTSS